MKQTEIGLIPDDWEVKKLETIALTASGGTPLRSNKSFYTGNVRWFTTSELKDCFLNDSNEHISQEAVFSSSAKIFPKQTLLMAMYGATIGRLGILNYPAATNQACCAIIPEHDDVLYLYYYLLHNRESIAAMGCGAGQPNISQEIIKNLLISLPPLEEQQRIAKALSDVDALITTTEKLIQKKKNIKQGTMQKLLTGKKRLPGFAKSTEYKQTELGLISEDWDVKNINKECTIKARIGWQGLKSTEYLDSGDYILITGTDFDNGFINWKSCSYVTKWRFDQDKNIQIKKGDVLVTKDGTIGKIAFLDSVPMQGTLNSGVFVVRPKDSDKIDSVFLSLIFKSIWFDSFLEQITSGSTIVHLYQKDFIKFNFPLPSKEEQIAIAVILSSMDKEIETLNTKLEKYRNLKTAMMQQLLTGKIRLV